MHHHKSKTSSFSSKFLLVIFVNFNYLNALFEDTNFELPDFQLVSTELHPRITKRDTLVSEVGEFLFTLDIYNDGRPLTIILRLRDSDLLAPDSIIQKIFNGNYEEIPQSSQLLEGYVLEEPYNSSVSGYKKNGNFYGRVLINGTQFCIDEFMRGKVNASYLMQLPEGVVTTRNALIFKVDKRIIGMILNQTERARTMFRQLQRRGFFEKTFGIWKGNGKLCSLIVVVDYSFLTKVHAGNVEAAVFHVLFSLEEANSIFRSTDFDADGIPDNIGFYVKKIMVVTTPESVFFLADYQKAVMDVNKYILTFNRFPELPNHCLGMAFTSQVFDKGTLGASYTPNGGTLYPTSGICDHFYPHFGSLNGLIITVSTKRTPLVHQLIFEVTITHELGHSFGATHDNETRCDGYIMSAKSHLDYYEKETHLMFSECSKKSMLETLVLKGGCFEPVKTSFCGNGLIEEGEDCDCGITRDCLSRDPCCTPRRTKDPPCKINRKMGYECHPSQGECCTKDCKYSNSVSTFLSCRNFNKQCPCSPPKTHCACGLNGICIKNECHSSECARLSLKECACDLNQNYEFCQVCCLYQEKCVPAYTATASLTKANKASKLLRVESDNPWHKSGIFLQKRFCFINDSCHKLQFYKGRVGDYCLHHGKLGKCAVRGCAVMMPNQTFPSFESSRCTMIFEIHVVKMCGYVVFNMLIVKLVL